MELPMVIIVLLAILALVLTSFLLLKKSTGNWVVDKMTFCTGTEAFIAA